MDKALQTFEDLVRRAIAPSMTFFVLLSFGELIRYRIAEVGFFALLQGPDGPLIQVIEKIGVVFTTLVILALVGLSYALSAAQQVLFDNFLKGDFAPRRSTGGAQGGAGAMMDDVEALGRLREKVKDRLKTVEATRRLGEVDGLSDYVLYEILGGIDTISTRPFVDSAKALGIFFSSVLLLSVGYLAVVLFSPMDLSYRIVGALVLVVIAALAWWVGFVATRAQYRMRAIRLYVNFLAMPSDFIHRRLLKEDWPEPKKDGS